MIFDNAKDVKAEFEKLKESSRDHSRAIMQWDNTKNAGFSTASTEELYLPVQESGENVEDQLADDSSLLHTTKKLIALRKGSHALSADGDIQFLNRSGKGYPMVYLRSGNDGKYLICINPTAVEQSFAYPLAGAKVIYENDRVAVTESGIQLSPASFAILKLSE